MTRKQPRQMRSLGDMPRPVIICEVIGVILLVLVYLAVNDFISLPGFMSSKNALMVMAFAGLGCLVPAAINIVWRAISAMPSVGIDSKSGADKKTRRRKMKKAIKRYSPSRFSAKIRHWSAGDGFPRCTFVFPVKRFQVHDHSRSHDITHMAGSDETLLF